MSKQSTIADNETAKAYDKIQSGYLEASNSGRLEILHDLKNLLVQVHSGTPIFDHHCYTRDGYPVYISAGDQLESIERHIKSLTN